MLASNNLSRSLYSRLSLMMFLQYAIWGAWLPLLWTFLSDARGFTDDQIGMMFAMGGVGALMAPFIAGQLADRRFNTEKVLGFSHVIGAILVWQLASLESYTMFLIFSLLYSIIYSPTLSLTNSLAFAHMTDSNKQFGWIRFWGTLGWIVVGIGIGQWLLQGSTPDVADVIANAKTVAGDNRTYLDAIANSDAIRVGGMDAVETGKSLGTALEGAGAAKKTVKSVAGFVGVQWARGMSDAFRLSALIGLFMGIFCFSFLPKTPPARDEKSSATKKALESTRRQPLLTLFLLAVPVSCIHQFYFVHTGPFLNAYQSATAATINKWFGVGGGGLMTVGQMAEILILCVLPSVAKVLSRKSLLAIGLGAYTLRMAIFANVDALSASTGISPTPLLMLGIALHGLCFGCFIFVAFMVVDEETTKDIRASAQSLFNLVIVGVGIIVGSMIASRVKEWAGDDWNKLFSVPMWASLACLAFLLVFYKKPTTEEIAAG